MRTQKKYYNRKNTSVRLSGGRKFGSGFKGSVMDLCNYNKHDAFNLCKQLKTDNIEKIILYIKNAENPFYSTTLDTIEKINEFIQYIKSPVGKHYVVKEFYNYKIRDTDFHNEMQSYETISKIITEKENLVGIPYQSKLLIGFEIHYKESIPQMVTNQLYNILQNTPFEGTADIIHEKINKRLFVINRKCQKTLHPKQINQYSVGTFKKMVLEIMQIIVKLNEINVSHGDIKLDNIMVCDGTYKLIDWEQSRKLNYYDLKLNLAMGSCPVYYIIKFG